MTIPSNLLFRVLCLLCLVGSSRPYASSTKNAEVTQNGHVLADDDTSTFSESEFGRGVNAASRYSNLRGGWSGQRDPKTITYDLQQDEPQAYNLSFVIHDNDIPTTQASTPDSTTAATTLDTTTQSSTPDSTTAATTLDTTTQSSTPDSTTVATTLDTTTQSSTPDSTTVATTLDTTTQSSTPDSTTVATTPDTTTQSSTPDSTTAATTLDTTTQSSTPDSTTAATTPDTTTQSSTPDSTTVSTTPKTSSASTIFSPIINTYFCLAPIIYALYKKFHISK